MNPLQGTEQTALPGRLNPFYLDGRTITLLLPIAQQLGLRDGQIIQASLEMRGETLKLLYNGQLIDLPPGLRFRPGEQVWLRQPQRRWLDPARCRCTCRQWPDASIAAGARQRRRPRNLAPGCIGPAATNVTQPA